jgi:integrase
MPLEFFQLLMSKSDPRMKAAFCLGLNIAGHIGEVAEARWSECDLNAGTFAADRNKTGIPRVAKLFPETIKALRDWKAATPYNQGDFIFVSKRGKPLTGEMLRQRFMTVKGRTDLPDSVTFEGVRDGAYLQAFRVSPVFARWIGGHASWTKLPSESKDITNQYVQRNPNDPNVIACCEAIRQYYFPPEKPAETKA